MTCGFGPLAAFAPTRRMALLYNCDVMGWLTVPEPFAVKDPTNPMFDVAKAFASISSAPFDGNWSGALAQISAAGSGWAGQMLGVSRSGELLYDIGHRLPAEALSEFEQRGGIDPSLNPRAKLLSRPYFETLGDNDVMCAEERSRSPFYTELFGPADAPFVCMARLPGPGGASTVVVSLRSASAGHLVEEDRLRFAMLLPHLAAAIRLRARLDGHGQSLVTDALEAAKLPAFLLSATGSVVGLTPSAETFAARGAVLHLRGRKLRALDRRSDEQLQAVIRRACCWSLEPAASSTSVVLQGEGRATTVEVAPLPRADGPTRHGAVAILTVVPPRLT